MRSALPNLKVVSALLLSIACPLVIGCDRIHGRLGPGPDVARPEAVLDFHTLYRNNCAACHGVGGKNGAAISLANPVYLSVAGEKNIERVIADGVPNKLMPSFAQSAGGMLTDRQVAVIAQGLLSEWKKSDVVATQSDPAYSATLPGKPEDGQQAFLRHCARCHGATGEGSSGDPKTGIGRMGSIVDPTYLALVSDQYLRSIIIAGRPDQGMPDWRGDSSQPLTDQQVTDIVAWLGSKRIASPGQPYLPHP
jgi:cytochrome c oxidase cbb3-type subunit 3/ubiquinol-cytochrome c reductase cytochrome c subunit